MIELASAVRCEFSRDFYRRKWTRVQSCWCELKRGIDEVASQRDNLVRPELRLTGSEPESHRWCNLRGFAAAWESARMSSLGPTVVLRPSETPGIIKTRQSQFYWEILELPGTSGDSPALCSGACDARCAVFGGMPDRIRLGARGRQPARHLADAGFVRAEVRHRMARGGDPHVLALA